jgi:hypothetical protein
MHVSNETPLVGYDQQVSIKNHYTIQIYLNHNLPRLYQGYIVKAIMKAIFSLSWL